MEVYAEFHERDTMLLKKSPKLKDTAMVSSTCSFVKNVTFI
jgi:hypothetical protein